MNKKIAIGIAAACFMTFLTSVWFGNLQVAAEENTEVQKSRPSLVVAQKDCCSIEKVTESEPPVVWVTIEMADRAETQSWYTESGEYVDWSTNDHGAVLVGYTEETVTIADPISGLIEYNREQFESVFEARGQRCVIISEKSAVEL